MSAAASRVWISKLKAAAWAVPVTICFNDVIAGPFLIAGSSMQPTLNPKSEDPSASDDVVLVQKWTVRLQRYCRGDVVVLRSPTEPDIYIVKRIIGLEGDWLSVPGQLEIEKIPKGCCWVEGDNARESHDSLNNDRFGSGRVSHVLWPLSRIGRVSSSVPPGRLLAKNETAFQHSEY
ncbi:hypothetical protein WJX73_000468 [Symbiochloris irregularis]|uniref:Mitochondrial inner membrane protease subunit 2 n=1 Tax=Symbiochloris irregularis TaxID=706552 RepID=A0AAW1PCA4_9CHLO